MDVFSSMREMRSSLVIAVENKQWSWEDHLFHPSPNQGLTVRGIESNVLNAQLEGDPGMALRLDHA